jgi:putative tricarboxylic transport membrane protein
MGDVYIMSALGIVTYFGVKLGLSPAAMVLGHILGGIAENGLLLGSRIANAKGGLPAYFFTRPICVVLIILTLVSILVAAWLERRHSFAACAGAGPARPPLFRMPEKVSDLNMRQWDGIISVLVMSLAVVLYGGADMLDSESGMFPVILAVILGVLALSLLVPTLCGKGSPRELEMPFAGFPARGMLLAMGCFLLYLGLTGWLGFYSATLLFMILLPLILLTREKRREMRRQIALVALLFSVALYLVFTQFLMVPTPRGVFL